MGGTGWCTHPKRQTSSDVRILVRKAELACRNAWGEDLWESLDEAEIDEPAASPDTDTLVPDEVFPQISYEDEVTSVVDAGIHRAQQGEDLNDRVVDQTNLDPDDEESDIVDDDRFGLLARGGQDSVSAARNRMRRRLQGETSPPADDHPRETDDRRFVPDDFVEEENPVHGKKPETKDATPDDDVMLSENVPPGTPRSRRLRRERERQSPPKSTAVAGTSPDVPVPAKTPGARDITVGDPFNTVPEIAPDIDISKLRASGQRGNDEPRWDIRPQAAPVREDSFEDAISSVHAIRAAARAEREERQRHNHRPQLLLRAAEPAPEEHVSPSNPVPEMHADDPPAPVDPAPQRLRVSTREFTDEVVFDPPQATMSAPEEPEPPRQDDPRESWWRGFFHTRQRSDARDSSVATSHDVYPKEEDTLLDDGDDIVDDVWPTLPTHWDDDQQPAAREDDRLIARSRPVERRDNRAAEFADPPPQDPAWPTLDLERESGMESLRDRLFSRPDDQRHTDAAQRQPAPDIAPDDLLDDPADGWYEPEPVPDFDVRRLIADTPALLDMTIEISPEVSRQCSTCRSYRKSERGERGWCTNTWAFTHRQMVNATDLACASTIGCWWLPADEEAWLDDTEPERVRTPRIDRLIAHLDPLKKAVGR